MSGGAQPCSDSRIDRRKRLSHTQLPVLCATTTGLLRTGRAEAVVVLPRAGGRRRADADIVFFATGAGARWTDGIKRRSPSTAWANARRFTETMLAGATP